MPTTAQIGTELRRIAGLFATGVTVVTASDASSGEPRGMTANGFMSVSLDPPLIAVSVSTRARLHEILMTSRRYGVTLLGTELEPEARRFAGQSVDREPAGIDTRAQTPVLVGGLAWLVADIVDRHPAGDHTLFIGQVIDMAVEHPDAPPLAFFRSRFSEVHPISRLAPVELDAWSADHWG